MRGRVPPLFIPIGKSMIFRTESLSAGAIGAPAVTIVKTVIATLIAAGAGLFDRHHRRPIHTLRLSDHELRDIGLEQEAPGAPIAYDLLDLAPRRTQSSRPALR